MQQRRDKHIDSVFTETYAHTLQGRHKRKQAHTASNMATLQALSFPSNQYCNEKHPLALRNNCEEAGDMLKERHMDPVSISTHGVSFCLLLCLLLTSSFQRFLTETHTHTHTFVSPMGYKPFSNSGHLEGQSDRRRKSSAVIFGLFNCS